MTENLSSKALEVNLAETHVQKIDIPARHRHFLGLSAAHVGIHKRAQEFMLEYHHPFTNRKSLIEPWREILLSDLWFYNSQSDAEKAFTTLIEVAGKLYYSEMEAHDKERIIQTLLQFIDSLCKLESGRPQVIKKCLAELDKYLLSDELVVIRNARYFQMCLSGAAQSADLSKQVFLLTKKVLQKSIRFWEATTDIESWFDQKRSLFHRDYKEIISVLGAPYFTDLNTRLEDVTEWENLLSQPSFDEIANHFRKSTDLFDNALERIYFVSYVLRLPGMIHLLDYLLNDINRLLKNVHTELGEDQIIAFLRNLVGLFGELKADHVSTLLDCFLTLGKEVIDTQNQNLVAFYENEMVKFGFISPGPIQIDQDWQIHRDPNHVKNIRTWLDLIEYKPSMMRTLLSSLIVNLRLGGVFITDTDLFQRDVSKLLNSDISPFYQQVKQLCRIFPVFFGEIGCEGELRDKTTALDEMSQRQDKLIHFLRKQTHTESNSTHVELVRKIMRFWHTGNLELIRDSVAPDVLGTIDLKGEWFTGINALIRWLCQQQGECAPEHLLAIQQEELEALFSRMSPRNEREERRLLYLVRIYELLKEKYSFEDADTVALLGKYPFFARKDIDAFAGFLESGDSENALKQLFSFVRVLNAIILDATPSSSWENIYYKRHIAAGIPSMYGEYREPKFEALGLIFRLEGIATALIERLVRDVNLDYITATTLRRIYHIMALFREGLELDGIFSQGFNSNIKMLDYSLTSASFSLDQYVNIFQFLGQDVKEIISEFFLRIYEEPLKAIISQMAEPRRGVSEIEKKQISAKIVEAFYRDILSSAFLVQGLDNFITNSISAIQNTVDKYPSYLIQKMMTYDPDMIVSSLFEETPRLDNQVFIGAKAYYIKKLHSLGFPVAPGFILTTELFRYEEAISKHEYLYHQIDNSIRSNIAKLEKSTGQQFGNPQNPLLFAVRGGSVVSMPGAMSTFLNVGMNDKIAEELAKEPRFEWAAWDCYRRFLQSWGMAHGIKRDTFDDTILGYKSRYKVEHKAHFTPKQMRDIAYAYKDLLHKNDIHFLDDPFTQLKEAISKVSLSWSEERTRTYREHMQIANEWGTAVVIQKMIFGNLNSLSGAGVLFTSDPNRSIPGVNLYGDFTICSQGEDIVAGLVHVLPLTEYQRKKDYYDVDLSLESAFPEIYKRLRYYSSELIDKHGFRHQEIEFTFESDQPDGLYILQTRNQNIKTDEKRFMFARPLDQMKLAGRGIGIGGGALCGLIAIDMEDLKSLSCSHPDSKRILVRPDTVPDDIAMIFESDGLLTCRGGATSHAAVTAVHLGKVCVVGCKELVINEAEKSCIINGLKFKAGDKISIDGSMGTILAGHYPVEFKEVL